MTTSLKFKPPVIGHRGACAYAPENTMSSFTKAAQLGVKWIEFDVMQALCGQPIIFHDEKLERTSNGHGQVSHYSYSYLSSLDVGAWFDLVFSGERIPTLVTVIEFLQNMKMSANIEIKALFGEEERLIKRVVEVLRPYLPIMNLQILFSSFSIDALYLLRQYLPDCQLGLLLHEWEPNWQEHCEKLHCVSLHINHEIMTAEIAHTIKAMDKILLCYTVNDPFRAKELYAWGVDAVFSDVPDKIIKHIG